MPPQRIHFHTRPFVANRKGRLIPLEVLLAVPKTLNALFAASLALLLFTGIYGYGRTIWSHGVYYASGVWTYVSPSRAYTAVGTSRVKSIRQPKPTRLPLTPDAPRNAAAAPSTVAAITESSATLVIKKLSVEAPVVTTAGRTQKSVNAALEKGVLLWPESAPLGAGGTTILLGHSSAPMSYRGKYGAVFSLLGKLATGDVVAMETTNATYRYRVRDRIIINPKKEKPDLLKQDDETILLVSCWPVGTNWQRVVVRAERVL